MVDALDVEVVAVRSLDLDAKAGWRSIDAIVWRVRIAGEQREAGDDRQRTAAKDRRLDDRARFRRRRERALEDDALGMECAGVVLAESSVKRLYRGKWSVLGSSGLRWGHGFCRC